MKMFQKTIGFRIFFWVFLVLIGAFVFLPLLWMINTALKPSSDTFTLTFFTGPKTLENILNIIRDPTIMGYLRNSLLVSFASSFMAIVVCAFAGYSFSKFRYRGRNSRIDELQAAVLAVKLRHLDAENERRRAVARAYIEGVGNPLLTLPGEDYWRESVFHIFPVLCPQRDRLQKYLADNGVETVIHYPIPPHRQQCYASWAPLSLPVTERIHREELSIPCNQTLTDAEVETITGLLNAFGG